jgi:hypothetical protein
MSFAFSPRGRGATLTMPLRFGTVVFNTLATADVLCQRDPPEEPAWPAAGSAIAPERAEALHAHYAGEEPIEPAPTAVEKREYQAYCELRARWLGVRSPTKGRVPAFKFSSNDGWIVDAEEAAIIAEAVASVLADEDQFELLCDILEVSRGGDKALREGLAKFQRFNARCAKADGYTVD